MSEIINNDYLNDLQKIKDTIKDNRNKAMVVVNSAMILTYYQIGTIINQRKTWGSKYIQKLSNDLQEYGSGYSYENLRRMSRIASEYTLKEIWSQLGTKTIPWRTLIEITFKCKTHNEMLWYINETHKNGWSRAMVMNQIAMKAYERNLIEPSTSISVKSDDSLNEIFKDTYVFDFLDKNEIKTEKDLKNQMIDNDTIGLLLCKEADSYVTKTVLNKSQTKIGISKYKIIEELPEYLEKRLKEK